MLSNGASLCLERGKTPTDTTSVAAARLREREREKKHKYAGVLCESLSEAGLLNTEKMNVIQLAFLISINSDRLYGGSKRLPIVITVTVFTVEQVQM